MSIMYIIKVEKIILYLLNLIYKQLYTYLIGFNIDLVTF